MLITPNERQAPTANNYSPTSARSTLARRKKGDAERNKGVGEGAVQQSVVQDSVVTSTPAVEKEKEEREEEEDKGGSQT